MVKFLNYKVDLLDNKDVDKSVYNYKYALSHFRIISLYYVIKHIPKSIQGIKLIFHMLLEGNYRNISK